MSAPFRFKLFNIQQRINSQKVGTDSMLLGAWSTGNFKTILDVGTGTGILALMLAQQNPSAIITAIEPDESFLEEARFNFSQSPFKAGIHAMAARFENFTSDEKFDLIISNPPYFENSSRSANELKNNARHTDSLPISVIYESAGKLLAAHGQLNLVFPHDLEERHFSEAAKMNLFPRRILRTLREDGIFKRTLVSYSFRQLRPEEKTMIVKHADNSYSQEYIAVTRGFYGKDLK